MVKVRDIIRTAKKVDKRLVLLRRLEEKKREMERTLKVVPVRMGA